MDAVGFDWDDESINEDIIFESAMKSSEAEMEEISKCFSNEEEDGIHSFYAPYCSSIQQ